MKPCKCYAVQPGKNGIWFCMLCRRQFAPLDQIEIADEQKPVSEAELNLRADYATLGFDNEDETESIRSV